MNKTEGFHVGRREDCFVISWVLVKWAVIAEVSGTQVLGFLPTLVI